jgi:hypothetical protein
MVRTTRQLARLSGRRRSVLPQRRLAEKYEWPFSSCTCLVTNDDRPLQLQVVKGSWSKLQLGGVKARALKEKAEMRNKAQLDGEESHANGDARGGSLVALYAWPPLNHRHACLLYFLCRPTAHAASMCMKYTVLCASQALRRGDHFALDDTT